MTKEEAKIYLEGINPQPVDMVTMDAAVWADAELFPVRRGLSPADLYGEDDPQEAHA